MMIGDDSVASLCWSPKNQKETISKVLSWITEAKLYKEQIPEPNFTAEVMFFANIWPSRLTITWDKHSLSLQPASYLFRENEKCVVKYIENVVKIEIDGKKNYIEAQELYKWLKYDEYKAEFDAD